MASRTISTTSIKSIKPFTWAVGIFTVTMLVLFALWYIFRPQIDGFLSKIMDVSSALNSFTYFTAVTGFATLSCIALYNILEQSRKNKMLPEAICQMLGISVWAFGLFLALGILLYQYLINPFECNYPDTPYDSMDCTANHGPQNQTIYAIIGLIVICGFAANVGLTFLRDASPTQTVNQISRIMRWQLVASAAVLAISINGEAGEVAKVLMLCIGLSGIGALFIEPARYIRNTREAAPATNTPGAINTTPPAGSSATKVAAPPSRSGLLATVGGVFCSTVLLFVLGDRISQYVQQRVRR